MEINEMVLVSVDDHVVEPPGLFDDRLPAKYVDLAPQFITNEDGTNSWLYEGQVLPNVALNAVAGRPREEYGIEPTSFDQLRPGCYDIDERVKDMDANGVVGSLCFPSFPQFCGQLFARTEDKDVALAMIRAYNDWHIDEWCGTHPGRFIPCALPAIWDPEIMAAEVRRTAAKGAHAVTFSENPSKLGWPSVHSDHWDPFWRACSEEQVVVCLHIGSSSELVITSPDAPMDCLITLTPMNIVKAATDLVWSPVLRKFPDLRVALSEGGIGWIPYFLERIDYNYDRHHLWTGQDYGNELPSEVFNRNVLTCFIDDRFGVASREFLEMDNVMWECDYPHSDSTWPTAPETLAESPGRGERRRHRPDHPPERHAPLPLRPVHRPRRQGALHGGQPAGPGGRATTCRSAPRPATEWPSGAPWPPTWPASPRPRLTPADPHRRGRSVRPTAATPARAGGRPNKGTTSMSEALSGVRVLEVAAWAFVPSAGAVLADWGADVIKVEHPETGDPQRGLVSMGLIPGGPNAVNYIMEQPNRGKRSIGIDISTDAGREVLYKLAETSDVFLTSFLPDVRQRLRIDVEHIRAVNPKIVYARGSGQGPARRRPGAARATTARSTGDGAASPTP